jgi:hypothetical protein
MVKRLKRETPKPETSKQVSRGFNFLTFRWLQTFGRRCRSIDERIGLTMNLVYSLRIEDKNDSLLKFDFEMK